MLGLTKNKHKVEEIRRTPFYDFGIRANDNFDMTDILKHIKTFNNCSELEAELNKLIFFIYNGEKTIFFHEFRQFPYISRSNYDPADISGLAKNYTNSDIYLIKFIRKNIGCKNKMYSFFDVDFIIRNTNRIDFTECSINNMPIDEILR